MRLAFELSMEHPTLPRADALAALESEGVHVRGVSFSPEILVVDSARPPRRAFERVALSRYVDRVLAMGPWPMIFRAAARVDLGGKSFRIRAHGPRWGGGGAAGAGAPAGGGGSFAPTSKGGGGGGPGRSSTILASGGSPSSGTSGLPPAMGGGSRGAPRTRHTAGRRRRRGSGSI